MPALTPNSPQSRFEYVLKLYWGKEYKGESLNAPVLDTFYVTTSLLGDHNNPTPDRFVTHSPGDLMVRYDRDDVEVERVQKFLDLPEPATGASTSHFRAQAARQMLKRLGQPYEYNERNEIHWNDEQWGLVDLVLRVVRLPGHAPADFLIPWIARELTRLAKHVLNALHNDFEHSSSDNYGGAVQVLYDKAPAIAQWAKETRADIGKVDLAQALAAITKYKFKQSLVEQGTVVYTFSDGWTVQELRTETALMQEGKAMQNCIAGYCEEVDEGNTRIYSIRDVAGQPHVSMELKSAPTTRDTGIGLSPEDFAEFSGRLTWHFAQILGKQNDAPTDEYRARAREFIDRVFDKEGFGWCIAGGTPKWARFAGRKLNGLNVPEILAPNHVDEDSILAGADFSDTDITNGSFERLGLRDCIFDRAQLSEANFHAADLHGASLEGVTCHFTNFLYANLGETSFDSAHLGGSDFRRSTLGGANLRDARVDGAKFDGAQGAASANWEGVELTTAQREQLGLPTSQSAETKAR